MSSASGRELWPWVSSPTNTLHGTPTWRLGAIMSIAIGIKVVIITPIGFIGEGGVGGVM